MALGGHDPEAQARTPGRELNTDVEEGPAQDSSQIINAAESQDNANEVSSQPNGQSQPHDTANRHHAEGDVDEDDEVGVEVEVEHREAPKKKRKKKNRPESKRGLNKPTGMEEFFADAPMTPEQYEENNSLYDPSSPFIERILTAMQGFEKSRKLTPERKDIFYKWLAFGGVEIAPNMFQSMDTLDTSNMTKAEVKVAMSQISIGTDKHDVNRPDASFAVDFLGCMKAFLSRRAVDIYGLESPEKTFEITATLERFMDYLLQHDVCTEYKDDIIATRNFCRTAPTELSAITNARRRLPGDFNIACSTIFGGEYGRNYDGQTTFAPDTAGEFAFVGQTKEVATHIINFGISAQAPEAIYQKHMALLQERNLVVVQTISSTGFEITCIEPPTAEALDIYQTKAREYRPVGTLYAKPWSNPELPPLDFSPEERASGGVSHSGQGEYVLLMEQACLVGLKVGMRMEASLHELSSGLWFMDEFINLYPTFDTYLVNELMVSYKKPRWLKGSLQYAEEEERERATEVAAEEARRKALEVEGGEEIVAGGEAGDGESGTQKGAVEGDETHERGDTGVSAADPTDGESKAENGAPASTGLAIRTKEDHQGTTEK